MSPTDNDDDGDRDDECATSYFLAKPRMFWEMKPTLTLTDDPIGDRIKETIALPISIKQTIQVLFLKCIRERERLIEARG